MWGGAPGTPKVGGGNDVMGVGLPPHIKAGCGEGRRDSGGAHGTEPSGGGLLGGRWGWEVGGGAGPWWGQGFGEGGAVREERNGSRAVEVYRVAGGSVGPWEDGGGHPDALQLAVGSALPDPPTQFALQVPPTRSHV